MQADNHCACAPARILIIYTGGTIGMIENPETGALENFEWAQFKQHVPELERFPYHIDAISFETPIDSSDMEPNQWGEMCRVIADNYANYDGFVLLHGTDTMAFTASALSFMLEGLAKPVIVTGSQLPISQLRTDGKENLLTSIEIAAARGGDGLPRVPEVCIFFENKLLRGNRTSKVNSEGFNAFHSPNLPSLAHAGIHIKYRDHLIRRADPTQTLTPHYHLDSNVMCLTLFPGIQREAVDAVFSIPGLRAIVLKTYGSGNAPQKPWFVERLRRLNERGIIVVNTTQCSLGTVEMGRYETSLQLIKAGVLGGYDTTLECVLTKLMYLLGHDYTTEQIIRLMNTSLVGEVTIEQPQA